VFGGGTAVTSVKGSIGHLIGGAGAASAAAAVLSLARGQAVPVANFENPDPDIEVKVIAEPRQISEPAVLVNAFGFGGHNASLVFRRS
jgi:3-oxoacyl-[acyl-carrier-protein] synthase II